MAPRFLTLLLALVAAVAYAEPPSLDFSPDTENATLRVAESTGLAIYRHDRAASIATDAIRSLPAFKNDGQGWVTEEHGGEITVTFIGGMKGQPPAALYRATVSNDGKLIGNAVALSEPAALTAFEASAAAARATALQSGFQPCSETYNSVVLPVGAAPLRKWVVYLLPATKLPHVVPAGGTFRFEIDESSRKVLSSRGFTRTCIQLQNDSRTEALMLTHLLDPTPTEAHVFWNLLAGKPLYVATAANGKLWAIEQGKIKLVK